MDITRKQLINLDPKTSPLGGPANAFTHIRAFPTAEMRAVVRPNFDTLYSSGWLDLTYGPVIVSTADTGGRYFMLPILDMWTDVLPYRASGRTAQARRTSCSCRRAGRENSREALSASTPRRLMSG
jgi:hypothetical protein